MGHQAPDRMSNRSPTATTPETVDNGTRRWESMRTPSTAPVVVGVNGTAASLAAVRLGAREAVARGRRLRIVHAFTWPGFRPRNDGGDYVTARHEAARIVDEAVASAARSTPGTRVSGF